MIAAVANRVWCGAVLQPAIDGIDVLSDDHDAHVAAVALLETEPDARGNVVFGARALTEVERRMGSSLLSAWDAGSSSLITRRAPRRSDCD